MAKKKATSSDVAARAGVSQATVSMVLNRKYNVSFSRETVERVEQAARELGYELPGRRKHKDDRKEKLIVVFCPTLTSPYYVLLLQGIEAVANEQGYGVFICNTQRDAGLEEKYLRMMQTMRPAGIIYTCNPHPDFQHQVEKIAKEILTTLPEDAQFTEEEQQQILRAIRGHRRKHEGMEPIEELFYDSDKRSRMCHSCPAQKQCNWTEEEKNMEIEI